MVATPQHILALNHLDTPKIEQLRAKSAAREFDRGRRRGQQNAAVIQSGTALIQSSCTGVNSSVLPT